MIDVNELSLISLAEIVLKEKKEPVDLYDLFDEVVNRKSLSIDEPQSLLNDFYAELSSSAKFVYTGANTWDLKSNQPIELWEKDGSFYNEYKEVSDLALDQRIAAQKEKEQAHQEMLDRRRRDEEEIARVRALEEAEAIKEAEGEPVSEEEDPLEDIKDISEAIEEEIQPDDELGTIIEGQEKVKELDESTKTIEEEDEPDEIEFDEDKYLKYMDDYEDEYDK